SGTIEAHWREAIFDDELMTGFVEATPAMPFSTITLASLEDLGLTVNYMTADPYTVPAAPLVSPRLGQTLLGTWEVLELPRFEVTRAGKILPIERR
ncbi:MAG TPA: leishmanolysin-related zinc metalloendopeptidase, partial [Gemmatimonadaceae bacterium]|nr:leishmanolysin-related zinc metalloendopeptidase [Gemmatimonadaceae bacterium]